MSRDPRVHGRDGPAYRRPYLVEPWHCRAHRRPAPGLRVAARQDRVGHRPSSLCAQDAHRSPGALRHAATAWRHLGIPGADRIRTRSVRRWPCRNLDLGRARDGARARPQARGVECRRRHRRRRPHRGPRVRGTQQRRPRSPPRDRCAQRQRYEHRAECRRGLADARGGAHRDAVPRCETCRATGARPHARRRARRRGATPDFQQPQGAAHPESALRAAWLHVLRSRRRSRSLRGRERAREGARLPRRTGVRARAYSEGPRLRSSRGRQREMARRIRDRRSEGDRAPVHRGIR